MGRGGSEKLHRRPKAPTAQVSLLTGSPGDALLGRRFRKLSLGQYDNEAGGPPAFSRGGWGQPMGAEQAPGLAPFLSPTDAKEVRPPPRQSLTQTAGPSPPRPPDRAS